MVNLKIPAAVGELVNALGTLQSKAGGKVSVQQFFGEWTINGPALKLLGLFLADGNSPTTTTTTTTLRVRFLDSSLVPDRISLLLLRVDCVGVWGKLCPPAQVAAF